MKFIGFYSYTVILTYMSLISGIVGMFMSYQGELLISICCLLFSGVCDMFDGVVARSKKNRTDDEKSFGIQIDTICDVICFGVFPAVFLFFSGVDSPWGIAVLAFYVLCGLIRLAFFNVLEIKRQTTESGCAKFYRGLPITSAAIIFPVLFFTGYFIPENVMTIVYYTAPLLAGFLFITDFRMPKLDIAKLFRRKA